MPAPPPSTSPPPGGESASEDGASATVHREVEGDVVVLTVRGHLDGPAGEALRRAAADVDGGAHRLDLDLREVTSFTAEGVAALVACRDLSAGLPEGLHYRTGRGPGRDALLAAYASVEDPEE